MKFYEREAVFPALHAAHPRIKSDPTAAPRRGLSRISLPPFPDRPREGLKVQVRLNTAQSSQSDIGIRRDASGKLRQSSPFTPPSFPCMEEGYKNASEGN